MSGPPYDGGQRALRVMIVDDNPDDRALVLRSLRRL